MFTKTRKLGIWLIACMHSIILLTFLIGGFGYAVFPLTLFNVCTLFYVFYNDNISFKELFTLQKPKVFIMFLIMMVLPIGNLLGTYDHILAFSYFSGKPKYCRVHFTNQSQINELPEYIKSNVREYQGQYYIDLNEWAGHSIKVMVYPENRVYDKIQQHINSYIKEPETHLEYY